MDSALLNKAIYMWSLRPVSFIIQLHLNSTKETKENKLFQLSFFLFSLKNTKI